METNLSYMIDVEDTVDCELNSVNLVGRITQDFERSHEQWYSSFVKTMVEIPRISGRNDMIPVIVDVEKILDSIAQSPVGKYVEINGRMCSYADFPNHEIHISRYVFANRFRMKDNECDLEKPVGTNQLMLYGTIKYYPTFKVTPTGRQIAEFIMVSKRRNGCSDRIPCVAWGENAVDISGFNKNTNMVVSGRIQSRDYYKTLDNGDVVLKTNYELSVFDYLEVNENVQKFTTNEYNGVGKLAAVY